MDSVHPASASGNGTKPIKWYSRSALDEFLSSAARERARLEATIADANARLARANSAVGLHQTMLEMLLDSQRDIREIRQGAELEAAEIIAAGEAEVDAVLRGVPAAAPTNGSGAGAGPGAGAGAGAGATASAMPPVPAPRSAAYKVDGLDNGQDDDFFTYLKGALDGRDELGPLGND